MRTTPSRFSNFTLTVDSSVEGRPASGGPPTASASLTPDTQLSLLERRHPAVIQTLRLLWGYPELNQYFEKVYSGLDSSLNLAPDAMAELMVLAAVHRRICPHQPAKPVEELYGSGRWADTWKPARLRR